MQDLTADGSLSIRERDSARASAAQGTADIEQAKATLEMSKQDLQTTIVSPDLLEADVANAKASLELAEIDLQNTRIIAPHRWPAWANRRAAWRICHRRNALNAAGAAAALGYRQPERDPACHGANWSTRDLYR